MQLEGPGLLVVRDLPRVGELGHERAVLAGERVLGDRVRHDAVGDEVLPDEVEELVVAAGTHRVHVVDADTARSDESAGERATLRSGRQARVAGDDRPGVAAGGSAAGGTGGRRGWR